MSTSGRRSKAGSRRGSPAARTLPAAVLPLAAATVTLAGWVVLVLTAIHFGRLARGGDAHAWWWLALAAVGAVGCLFGCLMLGATALRRTGVLAPRAPHRH